MDSKTEAQTLNIGLDPGFGGAKAACVGPEGARVATVPSVVGVGQTDLGLLSVGKLGRRRRSRQPDQVRFEGMTYLVGENVARYARPVERMDFLRLSDGPELRALFYDVVFRLLGEGQHRANVMAGLPVEVMADRAQAQSTVFVVMDDIQYKVEFMNHVPGGGNVLYMDGHVDFIRYPGDTPFSRGWAVLLTEAMDLIP